MKKSLTLAAAVATALAAYLVLAASASALPYVCYYSPDDTRSTSLSASNVRMVSSVTYQFGRDCSGRIVTLKTKRVDWSVTYTNSPTYIAKEVDSISLIKNGTTAYWANMRSQTCSGTNCTISMYWLPYAETAYDGSLYQVHGLVKGFGYGAFAGVDHTYFPTRNDLAFTFSTPGGDPPPSP